MFLNLKLVVSIMTLSTLSSFPINSFNNEINCIDYNTETCLSNFKYPKDLKSQKILAELPDEEIFMYAVDNIEKKLIKNNRVYKKIVLSVKGKKKYFSWNVISNESYPPSLILQDLNNDGVNELIIITTTATGTGVHNEDVHIFNTDTLKEIKVVDPLDIIKKNVKTKINKDKDSINIKILVNGETFELNSKPNITLDDTWFSDVYFGNIVNYNIVDNKLIATAQAQVSPTYFQGKVKIEYIFKDNEFQCDTITFKLLKDHSIFTKGYENNFS